MQGLGLGCKDSRHSFNRNAAPSALGISSIIAICHRICSLSPDMRHVCTQSPTKKNTSAWRKAKNWPSRPQNIVHSLVCSFTTHGHRTMGSLQIHRSRPISEAAAGRRRCPRRFPHFGILSSWQRSGGRTEKWGVPEKGLPYEAPGAEEAPASSAPLCEVLEMQVLRPVRGEDASGPSIRSEEHQREAVLNRKGS